MKLRRHVLTPAEHALAIMAKRHKRLHQLWAEHHKDLTPEGEWLFEHCIRAAEKDAEYFASLVEAGR